MCTICKRRKGGCRYTHGELGKEPLSEEDWREVWEHMTTVHIPFIHKVIARARKRRANEIKKHERKIQDARTLPRT